VIPARDEARFIARVLEGLPRLVDRAIVVDDGSADGTGAAARAALGARPGAVLRLDPARGPGAAVAAGLGAAARAGADAAVVLDGDGQMDPRDLAALLDPIADGRADLVKGDRFAWPGGPAPMPWARRLAGRLLAPLTRWASGVAGVRDPQCGYAALRLAALGRLAADRLWPGYGYPNDLLVRAAEGGLRVATVPVRAVYGEETSGLRALRDVPRIVALLWRRRAERLRAARPDVLVVTTSYPRHADDPAGGFVAELTGELAALGSARVVRPRDDAVAYGDGILENLRSGRARARAVPRLLGQLLADALRAGRGARVVVSHWAVPGGLVGALAALVLRARHVTYLHGSDVTLLERLPGGAALAAAVAALSDAVVAVGPELGERFAALLPAPLRARVEVAPLGAPPLAPAPERAGAKPAFLYLGRLIGPKGVDLLIDATAGRRDFEVTVAGDGALRPALEAQAARLRAPVRFAGRVAPAARAELLGSCDALVIPSRGPEGAPRVLLEARSAGLPVLGAAVAGVRSGIDDGRDGLLFEPGDAGALARALERFAADAALRARLREGARARAAAASWAARGEAHRAIVRRALAGGRRTGAAGAAATRTAPS
jgi:glycosyltransferase involved in cell wall biosynthesis